MRHGDKETQKKSKHRDHEDEKGEKNALTGCLPRIPKFKMSFPQSSNKRKHEESGKDQEKTAKKPRVQIYECIFPICSKRFHQNLSSFKMHFVNLHVKKEIEKCIIHYQQEQQLTDQRLCPLEPCGYYAPFW